MRPRLPDLVPSFQLYGEPPQGGLPDLVHIETLAQRSQLHDWTIKPHRHTDLWQIMWFQTAGVGVDLDGQMTRTATPAILFVPPMVVHGFSFTPRVLGTVTTFPMETLAAHGGWQACPKRPLIIGPEMEGFHRLTTLLQDLEAEYRRHVGRLRAIRALLELCLVWIERTARQDAEADDRANSPGHSENRVSMFVELVDANFARGWTAAEYARQIGISKAQLGRDCRAILGRGPIRVVHDRIVKEANRKLAYTPWPISQISEALGFADLGYFSRFYRERTGETPSRYRARIRARAVEPVPVGEGRADTDG